MKEYKTALDLIKHLTSKGIIIENEDYALDKLNWKATKGIEEMCKDSFKFVKNSNKDLNN